MNKEQFLKITEDYNLNYNQEKVNGFLTRPSNFMNFSDYDLFDTWSFISLSNRNSEILEQSNQICFYELITELTDIGLIDNEDYNKSLHNHWACGYINVLYFKIFKDDTKKELSDICKLILWFQNKIEDYPVFNYSHFSMMEYESASETLKEILNNFSDYDFNDKEIEIIIDYILEDPENNYPDKEKIESLLNISFEVI